MPASKKPTFGKIFTLITALVILFFAREPNPYVFAAGFFVALCGEALRFWAVGHLTKNVELTTSGPYAHLKHPLYVGTFLIMIGMLGGSIGRVEFGQINIYLLAFCFLVFILYYFPKKRKTEGERMIRRFGEEAEHWVANVPEFFPRFSRYERAKDKKWQLAGVTENSEEGLPLVVVIVFALIGRYWWMSALFGDNLPDWLSGKM